MTSVKGQIETRLRESLNPEVLIVEDFSAEHAGHSGARAGGESHFRIYIKADQLAGKSRVSQHRAIHALVLDLMPEPIHALEINIIEKKLIKS